MYFDAQSLERFYASALGRVSASSIGRAIDKLANFRSGSKLISVGYADPIRSAVAPAEFIMSLIPARLGVCKPGSRSGSSTVLTCLEELPLAKGSVDAALLMHALEYSDNPRQFLKELWRVLAPAGRFILLVPDRFGFWCRSEASPFSQGEPYTRAQIRQLLNECDFAALKDVGALHYPPVQRPVFSGLCNSLDRYGLGPAGVIAILGEKREETLARAAVKEFKPTFAPAAGIGALS